MNKTQPAKERMLQEKAIKVLEINSVLVFTIVPNWLEIKAKKLLLKTLENGLFDVGAWAISGTAFANCLNRKWIVSAKSFEHVCNFQI